MAGRFCQECGAPNDAIATYCAKCGTALRSGIPPPAATAPPPAWGPPAYAPPGYPQYPQSYPVYDYAGLERQKGVERTQWGILLLAVSALLAWIPFVNALGALLGIIGAILGIMGRKAFGPRHAGFVVASVVVWLLAVVPAFLGGFALGFTMAVSGDLRSAAGTVWGLMVGAVAGAIVQSFAWLLFAHELSTKQGRLLLYLGVVVGAIVGAVVLVFVVGPRVDAIVLDVQSGRIGTLNQLTDRLTEIETVLDLASAPSMALFGLAYILVYQRIARRQIPAAPVAPPTWPVVPPSASPFSSPPAPSAPSTPPRNPPPPP